MTVKRGRYTHDDIQAKIRRLALEDLEKKPSAIWREVRKSFPEPATFSLRTVQRIVSETRPNDPSPPWTLAKAAPDSALHVLPVIAAVALPGRRVTVNEGKWIARLGQAAPDLIERVPYSTYVLARTYMAAEQNGQPTEALDAFLAYAPWRSKESREGYEKAVKMSLVPGASLLLDICSRELEKNEEETK